MALVFWPGHSSFFPEKTAVFAWFMSDPDTQYYGYVDNVKRDKPWEWRLVHAPTCTLDDTFRPRHDILLVGGKGNPLEVVGCIAGMSANFTGSTFLSVQYCFLRFMQSVVTDS